MFEQVHLANLYGNDKASFDDRVSFVEQNMDKVNKDLKWKPNFFSAAIKGLAYVRLLVIAPIAIASILNKYK